jgi:hypothetical protein
VNDPSVTEAQLLPGRMICEVPPEHVGYRSANIMILETGRKPMIAGADDRNAFEGLDRHTRLSSENRV